MESFVKLSSLWVFVIVWFGQVISLIGSGLTDFALAVWVFQETGSATRYGLITVCAFLPASLISPLAGSLVDRWDRRIVMMLSDSGAALSTLALLTLIVSGQFELWHVYPIVIVNSLCSAFQEPAYLTTIPLLVPARHLGRANGMIQAGEAVSEIFAPLLGAALLVTIHLWGVILIDLTTFAFAILTLMFVRFPRPVIASPTAATDESRSLFAETTEGWAYINARPGLLALLLFLAATNFTLGMVLVLIAPLILGIANETTLGFVATISGIGLLLGGVTMSLWGGPPQRARGILGFRVAQGLLLLLVGIRPNIPLITAAAFLFMFVDPFIEGNAKVILQTRVAPEIQGRVFALRNLMTHPSFILAALAAGPLADFVFEPLFAVDGPLAGNIGSIIGVGPGRGTGFFFMIMGCLTIVVSALGYAHPRLRLLETELPEVDNTQHCDVHASNSRSVSAALTTPLSGSTQAETRKKP